MAARFVTLEGGEGVGKSTQMKALGAALRGLGLAQAAALALAPDAALRTRTTERVADAQATLRTVGARGVPQLVVAEQGGALRATWQHSRDTSAIWAGSAIPSTDGNYVAPGAIPWLRLTVVGDEPGPDGGDRLTKATYIHRVNTIGGIAPGADTPCDPAERRVLVPYEADYYFYRASGRP